ncbi:MAG: L-2-amino-thiazoline-4-carboxylic acid hydrolase [archaeon]|nr:L-2-amino-thiazoline-4-carboxylic acid hydrolase [archaeon]
MNEALEKLTKEELISYIEDLSKNWLAIDGTWFQAIEKELGMEKAIELDAKSWERFTVIEASRIKKNFNLPEMGGIPALIKALKLRVYANINEQEIIEVSENRCVFRMNNCRVQYARKSKNLPDFPCKKVGIVEYTGFASTIDQRIETRCICCPPDSHPEEYYCAWEFSIKSDLKSK